MRRKRSNSGVVRLSLCGRAAGRGWGWDNEEKEKGMSMSVSVSACSILLRATRIQRCRDWFHLLPPVDSYLVQSSHAETILGGETGE